MKCREKNTWKTTLEEWQLANHAFSLYNGSPLRSLFKRCVALCYTDCHESWPIKVVDVASH